MALGEPELAELRRCMYDGCGYSMPNGLTNVDHIWRALNNHILGQHPLRGGGAGNTVKSTGTLPVLEESITETQYQAWLHRFNCYCVSCKLSHDDIKNRIFKAVPTTLADQICVDMDGTESKDGIFENVKNAVVKKR